MFEPDGRALGGDQHVVEAVAVHVAHAGHGLARVVARGDRPTYLVTVVPTGGASMSSSDGSASLPSTR